jgi:hypothetical protein
MRRFGENELFHLFDLMAKGCGLDEIRRAFDFHRTTVSRHYYIAKAFFLKRPTDSSMAQDISRDMGGGYDPSAHMIRADLRTWIEWCRLRAAQLAVVVKEPSLRSHFNANEGQLVRLTVSTFTDTAISVSRLSVEVLGHERAFLGSPFRLLWVRDRPYEVDLEPGRLREYVVDNKGGMMPARSVLPIAVFCQSPSHNRYWARINVHSFDPITDTTHVSHLESFQICFGDEPEGIRGFAPMRYV